MLNLGGVAFAGWNQILKSPSSRLFDDDVSHGADVHGEALLRIAWHILHMPGDGNDFFKYLDLPIFSLHWSNIEAQKTATSTKTFIKSKCPTISAFEIKACVPIFLRKWLFNKYSVTHSSRQRRLKRCSRRLKRSWGRCFNIAVSSHVVSRLIQPDSRLTSWEKN